MARTPRGQEERRPRTCLRRSELSLGLGVDPVRKALKPGGTSHRARVWVESRGLSKKETTLTTLWTMARLTMPSTVADSRGKAVTRALATRAAALTRGP